MTHYFHHRDILTCTTPLLSIISIAQSELVVDGYPPDHARGRIAHGSIFGFDEFLVVVDAAVDLIVLLTRPLLERKQGRVQPEAIMRNIVRQ